MGEAWTRNFDDESYLRKIELQPAVQQLRLFLMDEGEEQNKCRSAPRPDPRLPTWKEWRDRKLEQLHPGYEKFDVRTGWGEKREAQDEHHYELGQMLLAGEGREFGQLMKEARLRRRRQLLSFYSCIYEDRQQMVEEALALVAEDRGALRRCLKLPLRTRLSECEDAMHALRFLRDLALQMLVVLKAPLGLLAFNGPRYWNLPQQAAEVLVVVAPLLCSEELTEVLRLQVYLPEDNCDETLLNASQLISELWFLQEIPGLEEAYVRAVVQLTVLRHAVWNEDCCFALIDGLVDVGNNELMVAPDTTFLDQMTLYFGVAMASPGLDPIMLQLEHGAAEVMQGWLVLADMGIIGPLKLHFHKMQQFEEEEEDRDEDPFAGGEFDEAEFLRFSYRHRIMPEPDALPLLETLPRLWLPREDEASEQMLTRLAEGVSQRIQQYLQSMPLKVDTRHRMEAQMRARVPFLQRVGNYEPVGRVSCGWCGDTKPKLSKCARCRLTYFCGVDCQRATWPYHRISCKKKKK